MGLQRVLGLGSYKTAWSLLHKLRRAMVRPGRDRLHGTVEVDETYWGGEEEGVIGRLTDEKALILVAAQEDGAGIGRIRLRRVPDLTKASLHGFITQAIEPGSTVRTDGLRAYLGLGGLHPRPEGTTLLPRRGTLAAPRAPGCLVAEAVVARHSPGCHRPRTSGLLPRRVHFQVQPPQISLSRQALLSISSAGCAGAAGYIRGAESHRA